MQVRPAPPADEQPIIVRTLGARQLPPGARVALRACGPVLAWPGR
ncbi:MAG: hypothetical protein ACLQDY_11200 [Streptosporangiaceae bacterium]